MKNVKITKRKLTKISNLTELNKNREFVATIVKASGEVQTRHFVATDKKVAVETASKGYARFYDVEKGRLSSFDLSTAQGDILAVN